MLSISQAWKQANQNYHPTMAFQNFNFWDTKIQATWIISKNILQSARTGDITKLELIWLWVWVGKHKAVNNNVEMYHGKILYFNISSIPFLKALESPSLQQLAFPYVTYKGYLFYFLESDISFKWLQMPPLNYLTLLHFKRLM